jgi:hypothetical protein
MFSLNIVPSTRLDVNAIVIDEIDDGIVGHLFARWRRDSHEIADSRRFIFQLPSITSFHYVCVASPSNFLDVSHRRSALSNRHPSIASYEEPSSRQYSDSISLHPQRLDNSSPAFFDYSLHPWNRNTRPLPGTLIKISMKDCGHEGSPIMFRIFAELCRYLIKSTFRNIREDCIALFACRRN